MRGGSYPEECSLARGHPDGATATEGSGWYQKAFYFRADPSVVWTQDDTSLLKIESPRRPPRRRGNHFYGFSLVLAAELTCCKPGRFRSGRCRSSTRSKSCVRRRLCRS